MRCSLKAIFVMSTTEVPMDHEQSDTEYVVRCSHSIAICSHNTIPDIDGDKKGEFHLPDAVTIA